MREDLDLGRSQGGRRDQVEWRRGLDRGESLEIRFWSDLERGGLFIGKKE